MKSRTAALCLLLCCSCGVAATAIPKVVSAGSYSVSLDLEPELWAVRTIKKEQAIEYSYLGFADGKGEVFQINVQRVSLPDSALSMSTGEFVAEQVKKDGLKFNRAMFSRRILLRPIPEEIFCPAGSAYLIAPEEPVFSDPAPHFAAVALILPHDYRKRKVGYLIVGHQVGRRRMEQEQLEYVRMIIQNLREEANKAPEPTPLPVTPPAEPGVAPGSGVAHL